MEKRLVKSENGTYIMTIDFVFECFGALSPPGISFKFVKFGDGF
ncbi:hypothetical protein CEV33_2373 [Brucella grignonensis]|uniref:Uncharacterized protein n=1 Tax=Brucella grignonensis TaxID=94627 RepID=A0A256F7Q2_9HYPH|nr:hypothetical protein CEV33_2373 [Brucella grignonensis]